MMTRNTTPRGLSSLGVWLGGSMLMLLSSTSMAQTVLIVGDSISAGYGISVDQGWVNLLNKRIQQQIVTKPPQSINVINASVSGETTSGGLARLPKLLATHQPSLVVLELGGNDGLRGQPPQIIEQNLGKMIQLSQNAKAKVVLLGMKIPPNYGAAYSKAFEHIFPKVAARYNVPLMPFFLEGVGGNSKLMQEDRIHPRAEAQGRLLENAWPVIKPLLQAK
jgi:acyl-CoA thioesterase-1